MFTLGGRKNWPDGWSQPAPMIWPRYKKFPPVWIKTRAATQRDIDRLYAYYGKPVDYDSFSIVGKGNVGYTTLRDKEQAKWNVRRGWRYVFRKSHSGARNVADKD